MRKLFPHRLTSQTSQKYSRSIVILRRVLLWMFGKRFRKRKKKHSFHNKHIYIHGVTDILKFYECLVHIVKVFFSLKDSYYAYIPLYMNWILPTSGNEKEQQQIKFYEKLLDELIFSRVTIHLKNFYFTSPTGQVLKK